MPTAPPRSRGALTARGLVPAVLVAVAVAGVLPAAGAAAAPAPSPAASTTSSAAAVAADLPVAAAVLPDHRQVAEHRAITGRVQVYDVDPGDSATPTGTVAVADRAPSGATTALTTLVLQPDPADASTSYADLSLPDGVEELHDLVVTYSGDAAHAAGEPTAAGLEVVSSDEPAARSLQRLYFDLLRRQPDADGYAYWLPVVRARGGDAADAAWAFVRSPEYLGREVVGAYTTFLHRDPDADGLAYYQGLLARSTTVQDLKTDLMSSPEYAAAAGAQKVTSAGHAAFLDAAYEDCFGRAPDPSGQGYYLSLLNLKKTTRANVAYELAVSDEHQRTFLDDAYVALLERPVDDAGQAYWARQIRAGYRQELVVYSLATSPEYRSLLGS